VCQALNEKQVTAKGELKLDLEPVAGALATAVASGSAREIACYGTRGDGKTFAAFVSMIMHSVQHKAALPAAGAMDGRHR
jgi:hypothetical protein